MKCVHVLWIDSETEQGWDTIELEHERLDLCHTVGLYMAETEHYVIVAHSFDPATKESNGRISIPIAAIVEMRTLCQIKV